MLWGTRAIPTLSTSMTCPHEAPAGSPGTEAKLGSQWSTSPLLRLGLTVWRQALGAHINRAASPGTEQNSRNTGVYASWLRLPCQRAEGAFQHWQ